MLCSNVALTVTDEPVPSVPEVSLSVLPPSTVQVKFWYAGLAGLRARTAVRIRVAITPSLAATLLPEAAVLPRLIVSRLEPSRLMRKLLDSALGRSVISLA